MNEAGNPDMPQCLEQVTKLEWLNKTFGSQFGSFSIQFAHQFLHFSDYIKLLVPVGPFCRVFPLTCSFHSFSNTQQRLCLLVSSVSVNVREVKRVEAVTNNRM